MNREGGAAILRGVSIAGLAILACISAVVFALHRSADADLLGWSLSYLLGAVLPLSVVFVAQAALVLLPPLSRRRDRIVALGCVLTACLLLLVGVALLPLYELPVLATFLALMALALAGYRAFRADHWLGSYIALTFLSLLFFVPETIGLLREGRAFGDHKRPRWGDRVTFRDLFPSTEPFISPGGRLQPNLDLQVFTGVPGWPSYHMRTNSEGFRNGREIPLNKEPGELRILNLGDSFSIGCGVGQDQFIGAILESKWPTGREQKKVTVLNPEVSDPAYGLLYLQRHGIAYSPDIVLYGYADNDIHQAYLPFAVREIFSLDAQGQVQTRSISAAESTRRVYEAQRRFAEYLYPATSLARARVESSLRSPTGRWAARLTKSLGELWLTAPVFHRRAVADENDRDGELTFISTTLATTSTAGHLRLIDFATDWGMLYKQGDAMTAPLYANLFEILRRMQKTAAAHGAAFVFVYFPRREQVQPQDWRRFRDFWNLDPEDFDLDLEAARLRSFCDAEGIPFVDTTPALRAAAVRQNLYLPHDLHLNEYGQAAAAEAILRFAEGPR